MSTLFAVSIGEIARTTGCRYSAIYNAALYCLYKIAKANETIVDRIP